MGRFAKIAGDDTCTEGGTTSSEATPGDVAAIQQRLRILQWATPALTGVIILLGAQQGEQPSRAGPRLAQERELTPLPADRAGHGNCALLWTQGTGALLPAAR